ncbi:MAG: LptF/LptG family permease [Bacteroidetes bacterium]|nr:LptF/LptG family permease [Bacteroidota bacterium]
MKKLNLLVLRSFAGPMLVTFLISLFVLIMQFLWKYIDDLVGKGLEWYIIVKLMVYVSITLVPLALPLSLLLSSIMTFGNLAEHFELTAFKSAGVSLQRVMRPLVITAFLISGAAFIFSNYILPIANLKMNALLYDVRQQKPALLIQEGIFYNGIDGYSIKIGKKEDDGQTLRNIMIYDHTTHMGNTKVIMADRGRMAMSDDERYLILNLFKGYSYEEKESRPGRNSHPMMRTEFEEETIRMDLSSFKMTRTNEQLFRDNYQMLNLKQLSYSSDSIERKMIERKVKFYRVLVPTYNLDSASTLNLKEVAFKEKKFIDNFPRDRRVSITTNALYAARNIRSMTDDTFREIDTKSRTLARHNIEWQRKFTLSFACLILFFIGAPLGAIIRKGGLGMPMVVSIFFFVIYHIISITGEKFAREEVLKPFEGMWLSTIILLPIGVFLIFKATTDSALFERDAYVKFFKKFTRKKNQHT